MRGMGSSPETQSDGAPGVARRAAIRSLIEASPFVRVADLSARFGVSTVTVRADLELLEAEGIITRVRGGAMPAPARAERPFEEAQVEAAAQKARIATVAVDQLESGMTVLLDVGTTTSAIAHALAQRSELHDLTVITSGLTIALALETALDRLNVVVTGGSLRRLQHSLVPPLADTVLSRVHADVAFIGCTGVDAVGGITNINLPETEVKRAMVSAASRVVVVADSSKLGRVHVGRIAETDAVDVLITGADADRAQLSALRNGGIAEIRTA